MKKIKTGEEARGGISYLILPIILRKIYYPLYRQLYYQLYCESFHRANIGITFIVNLYTNCLKQNLTYIRKAILNSEMADFATTKFGHHQYAKKGLRNTPFAKYTLGI